MTYVRVRASRDTVIPAFRTARRLKLRWLVVGGLGIGLATTAWTAVALVAPSVVSSSMTASLNLRTADPFAPKLTVISNRLPASALAPDDPARIIAQEAMAASQNASQTRQVASAEPDMPALVGSGRETSNGAPPAGPQLASLTPYANDEEIASPTISTVAAVNSNPPAPDMPAAPVGPEPEPDVTITGSLPPQTVPLPPVRDVDLAATEEPAASVPLPPASPVRRPPGPVLASLAPVTRSETPRPDPAPAMSVPSFGNRTAIYDISAHTVYLPNGERLEAHSGLGGLLDDPDSVHVKNRGATPPHTYDLTMREQLFHGVAALRLTPTGGGNVYGRVGLLAHTYMLGPRGDSNGCVSFKDYSRFLRAYRNGEVTKLAVVPSVSRSQVASRSKKSWWWFASSTD